MTFADCHADTLDCKGCGKRLPREDSILNALASSADAERAMLAGYRRDMSGKYLGKIACFDSACADCRLFASAKVSSTALVSGALYTIPPFGAPHFEMARQNGDADRAYFDIMDITGKRFVIPFTAIVSVRPSQRGTKSLVSVTVRIP